MAAADGVISVSRLRFAVGESTSSLDDELVDRRLAAIDIIERMTGRAVLDRVYTTGLGDFQYIENPDMVVFRVCGVKDGDITLSYNVADADVSAVAVTSESFTIPSSSRVHRAPDHIAIYAQDNMSWRSVMRFDHPTPTLQVTIGMDIVPPAIGEACALLVREMLEGSSFDEIAKKSPVDRLLMPYKRTAYKGSVRARV